MDLYIKGEKLSEEMIKQYDLKPGSAVPFSRDIVTRAPETKSELKVVALKAPEQE